MFIRLVRRRERRQGWVKKKNLSSDRSDIPSANPGRMGTGGNTAHWIVHYWDQMAGPLYQ